MFFAILRSFNTHIITTRNHTTVDPTIGIHLPYTTAHTCFNYTLVLYTISTRFHSFADALVFITDVINTTRPTLNRRIDTMFARMIGTIPFIDGSFGLTARFITIMFCAIILTFRFPVQASFRQANIFNAVV